MSSVSATSDEHSFTTCHRPARTRRKAASESLMTEKSSSEWTAAAPCAKSSLIVRHKHRRILPACEIHRAKAQQDVKHEAYSRPSRFRRAPDCCLNLRNHKPSSTALSRASSLVYLAHSIDPNRPFASSTGREFFLDRIAAAGLLGESSPWLLANAWRDLSDSCSR